MPGGGQVLKSIWNTQPREPFCWNFSALRGRIVQRDFIFCIDDFTGMGPRDQFQTSIPCLLHLETTPRHKLKMKNCGVGSRNFHALFWNISPGCSSLRQERLILPGQAIVTKDEILEVVTPHAPVIAVFMRILPQGEPLQEQFLAWPHLCNLRF